MKKLWKQLYITFTLLFLLLIMLMSSALAEDTPGVHFTEEDSENIAFEDLTLWESLFSPFAIYTDEGTYEPGDTAEFIVQSTSWNLHCSSSWLVVELYDQNGDFVESDSEYLGTIKGNTDVNKRVSIGLSSRAESGTWTAVEYLWCTSDDTSYDGVNHANQVISTSTKVSFQVDNPEEDCAYTYTGYQNQYSCSGDRVQQLYVSSTSTCSAQWRDSETCDNGCSGGECIDSECVQNSDCSSGFACDAGDCVYTGTGSSTDTGTPSSGTTVPEEESYETETDSGLGIETWQVVVLIVLVLVGIGVFMTFRRK